MTKVGQWKGKTCDSFFTEVLVQPDELIRETTNYRRTGKGTTNEEEEDGKGKEPGRVIHKEVQRSKKTAYQEFILISRNIISFILSAPILLILLSIATFKTAKVHLLEKTKRIQEDQEALKPDELLIQDETYYADRWGYKSEMHQVLTQDGYVLQMYRISKKGSNPQGKRPVFIGHGLFQCSGAFVLNEENSMAFVLIDQGYDVWVGNNRSISGLDHISLSHEDPEYWNWGLKELGIYDFPAMVDYVRSFTDFSKIAYIGHSQGNAQAFIGLSLIPELADKLSCFVALAPAVFSGNLVKKAKYFQFTPRPVSTKLIADWIAGWGRKGVCLYIADQNNHQQQKITQKVPLVVFYGTADYLVNGERFVRTFNGYETHGLSPSQLAKESSNHEWNTAKSTNTLFPMLDLVHVERIEGYEHMDTIWGHDNHKTTYPIVLSNLEKARWD
ncbi:Alpha/Beta hydrolase protein [Mucor mucedo]|uniref:Alpha/Beta hydrolase protein n=1 Tax=Mucor mucedo TaxID=29922 RepID=UPI00221FC4EA|nr:Alpha/Beta hydrolase protein [Mucor mucedo]KAI7894384.1 Alpha/Beta hydrolase protein [Mucor mucedo]